MSLLRSAKQHVVVYIHAAAADLFCILRLLHCHQVPPSEREVICKLFWDERLLPDSLHT